MDKNTKNVNVNTKNFGYEDIDSDISRHLSTSESSIPHELTDEIEVIERSDSNSELKVLLNGKEYSASKKNDRSVSLKSIENLIESLNIDLPNDKIKIMRHSINFVVCEYFNLAEAIINSLHLECDNMKKLLNNSLSGLKEIIKNNHDTDKINLLIKSNDIKNDILKILIEIAIIESYGCKDFLDFYILLFQNLPEQFYSFESRFLILKAKLESKFGENQITIKLNDIHEKKILITNPWLEKKNESIKTFCYNLRNDLLSMKRKPIFIISKDYTELIRQIEFESDSNTDLNLKERELSSEANVHEYQWNNFFYNSLNNNLNSPILGNFECSINSNSGNNYSFLNDN